MAGASAPEIVAGFLLVFFLPGYSVTRAAFPEWRIRGPSAMRRAVEEITLSFVLSVVLTVLVGGAFLSLAPAGFQASWSDPALEAALAGIAAVALVVAWARGSFRRSPPVRAAPIDLSREEGALELTRHLDELSREERRVRHLLRAGVQNPEERDRLNQRLEEIRAESLEIAARREAEYAE